MIYLYSVVATTEK